MRGNHCDNKPPRSHHDQAAPHRIFPAFMQLSRPSFLVLRKDDDWSQQRPSGWKTALARRCGGEQE